MVTQWRWNGVKTRENLRTEERERVYNAGGVRLANAFYARVKYSDGDLCAGRGGFSKEMAIRMCRQMASEYSDVIEDGGCAVVEAGWLSKRRMSPEAAATIVVAGRECGK